MADNTPVAELKRQPSEPLIAALKKLLEEAESGNLLGVLFLCNYADGITGWNAGHVPWSTMLGAIEDWKFQTLKDRWP